MNSICGMENTIYFDPIENAISLIKEEHSTDLGNLLEDEMVASKLFLNIFADMSPQEEVLSLENNSIGFQDDGFLDHRLLLVTYDEKTGAKLLRLRLLSFGKNSVLKPTLAYFLVCSRNISMDMQYVTASPSIICLELIQGKDGETLFYLNHQAVKVYQEPIRATDCCDALIDIYFHAKKGTIENEYMMTISPSYLELSGCFGGGSISEKVEYDQGTFPRGLKEEEEDDGGGDEDDDVGEKKGDFSGFRHLFQQKYHLFVFFGMMMKVPKNMMHWIIIIQFKKKKKNK